MRSFLALSLLMILCASASAATVHHTIPRHHVIVLPSQVWRLNGLTYRELDIGAADSATQMRSRDLVAFMAPITAGFVAPCNATRIGAANDKIALVLCH
jgi:hypothetical protein